MFSEWFLFFAFLLVVCGDCFHFCFLKKKNSGRVYW